MNFLKISNDYCVQSNVNPNPEHFWEISAPSVSVDSVWFCWWGSPLTFSMTPRDNVIMIWESLLSNLSPPCDEGMLCEHVKHHTPEHLSVSASDAKPLPHCTGQARERTKLGGRGLVVHICSKREEIFMCGNDLGRTVNYNAR